MTHPTQGHTNLKEVEARLAAAWAFLRGQPRNFSQLMNPAPPPLQLNHKHLLSAAALHPQGTLAGVGLVLARAEAVEIAAAMFAVAPAELSEADIDDACGEACNVMSACVAGALQTNQPVIFARPRELPSEHYQALANASTVLTAFQSGDPADIVTLTVFDPLANPAPMEQLP